MKYLLLFLFLPLSVWATTFYDYEAPLVHDFSVTNVNSNAWVAIRSNSSKRTQAIEVSNGTSNYFFFGFSSSGDPSGDGSVILSPTGIPVSDLSIPSGSSLFLKAVDTDTSSGKIFFNILQEPVIQTQ